MDGTTIRTDGPRRCTSDSSAKSPRFVMDKPAAEEESRHARIGLAGIVWPSILWPDDDANATIDAIHPCPGGAGGGTNAMRAGRPTPSVEAIASSRSILSSEESVRRAPPTHRLIDESHHTTRRFSRSTNAALIEQFRSKLDRSSSGPSRRTHSSTRSTPDYAEGAIGRLEPDSNGEELLDRLGDARPRKPVRAAAARVSGDPFKQLWAGAKDALRVAMYWQMKQRAGIVGRTGLGAVVLTRLTQSATNTRVIYSAIRLERGLCRSPCPDCSRRPPVQSSPVKSLFLLQGAFSHYAFADRLPHDASRSVSAQGHGGPGRRSVGHDSVAQGSCRRTFVSRWRAS